MNELYKNLNDNSFEYKRFNFNNLDFKESVKLLCFYCRNYNNKWTCPPRIDKLDYRKIFSEYNNRLLIYKRFDFTEENYEIVRRESTLELHNKLLELEKFLFESNYPFATSFIGGSCKLCKECNEDRCNNPTKARIPIEATGIDLISSFKKIGIDIKFPVKDHLYRYGILLW